MKKVPVHFCNFLSVDRRRKKKKYVTYLYLMERIVLVRVNNAPTTHNQAANTRKTPEFRCIRAIQRRARISACERWIAFKGEKYTEVRIAIGQPFLYAPLYRSELLSTPP